MHYRDNRSWTGNAIPRVDLPTILVSLIHDWRAGSPAALPTLGFAVTSTIHRKMNPRRGTGCRCTGCNHPPAGLNQRYIQHTCCMGPATASGSRRSLLVYFPTNSCRRAWLISWRYWQSPARTLLLISNMTQADHPPGGPLNRTRSPFSNSADKRSCGMTHFCVNCSHQLVPRSWVCLSSDFFQHALSCSSWVAIRKWGPTVSFCIAYIKHDLS